jgi:hypothetical protein
VYQEAALNWLSFLHCAKFVNGKYSIFHQREYSMFYQRKKERPRGLESWCGCENETYSNLHSCGIPLYPFDPEKPLRPTTMLVYFYASFYSS